MSNSRVDRKRRRPWSWGIPAKYGCITIASFVAIMVIYELLVRRINLLRFLFGMRSAGKIKKSKAGPA
jgi:hypothetical protein